MNELHTHRLKRCSQSTHSQLYTSNRPYEKWQRQRWKWTKQNGKKRREWKTTVWSQYQIYVKLYKFCHHRSKLMRFICDSDKSFAWNNRWRRGSAEHSTPFHFVQAFGMPSAMASPLSSAHSLTHNYFDISRPAFSFLWFMIGAGMWCDRIFRFPSVCDDDVADEFINKWIIFYCSVLFIL